MFVRSLVYTGGFAAVLALASGCMHGRSDDPNGVLAQVLTRVDDECAERLGEEFRVGQRLSDECNASREMIAETLAKEVPARFGVLEQQLVDLHAMSFIFSEASECERWPLRVAGHHVLSVAAAKQSGCRVDRLEGEIVLTVMDIHGVRHEHVLDLPVHKGRLRLEVAALDRLLRARGFHGIDELRYLEFGERGWGGWVNVQKLRTIRTSLHWQWVAAGRGSPELLLARHPDQSFAEPARVMVDAVQRQRHADDYAALQRGELPLAAFLWRHPTSPYRAELVSQRTAVVREPGLADVALGRPAATPSPADVGDDGRR